MQSASIDGHVIEYRLEGPATGPVLVFSNSLGTDLRVWDALLPHLPDGLQLLRYSKAGHGLSDFAGERDIDAHARDLLGLLDHLGVGRATVVGLSVGGMIALALSAMAPARVRGLVLCCTAHRIGSAELWEQRIDAIRKDGLASIADSVMGRWFSEDFRQNNATELALWRNMVVRNPADGYMAICAAIRDADLTEAARNIEAPTLCVAGSEDGSTPPDVVRSLADLIAGAQFELIEGSAHVPCVQSPERLGMLMTRFLKENRLG